MTLEACRRLHRNCGWIFPSSKSREPSPPRHLSPEDVFQYAVKTSGDGESLLNYLSIPTVGFHKDLANKYFEYLVKEEYFKFLRS